MHNSGFELRHSENLREHYAKTLEKWCHNLQENWDEAVAEVGINRARIWNLYMTLSQIGFESNSIQVHQFLGVDNNSVGTNNFPLRLDF
jgi:cyclopropane-fatty-acyl-phospholipid synthase